MTDERAAEGLDHLQRAGRELIAAARAFLDVAEDLVNDRERVADVVTLVGAVAGDAVNAARTARPGGERAADHPDDGTGASGGPGGPVEHIDVS